ncbi:MAG: circadian clock KaiB family protein [Rhodospirillaceae bacterium]|nr:circadian clock KaiB family protein [Rhodospirillaceae bacterium]
MTAGRKISRRTAGSARVVLRLFVTGATPSAVRARACLNDVCAELRQAEGDAAVDLQVIDVLSDPESAIMDDVFATPTVIRVAPAPGRRLFGDLSSPEMVMIGLQIAPEPVPA